MNHSIWSELVVENRSTQMVREKLCQMIRKFFFSDKVMLDAEMGPLSIYVNFRIIEKHGTFIGNSIIWGVYGHVLCLAQKELVHG